MRPEVQLLSWPRVRVSEALVVAKVQVGFGAVVGDENLAVLERVHGAGIDVDVGIELLEGDPKASGLEQRADGRRGQTLAK